MPIAYVADLGSAYLYSINSRYSLILQWKCRWQMKKLSMLDVTLHLFYVLAYIGLGPARSAFGRRLWPGFLAILLPPCTVKHPSDDVTVRAETLRLPLSEIKLSNKQHCFSADNEVHCERGT